jgi:TonB family protein
MRKLALLLPFLAASTLAATSTQSLGAHSAQHELRLERSVVAPDRVAYDITVTDVAHGATLLSSHIEGKPGESLAAMSTSGARRIYVYLAYPPGFFSAAVDVVDGSTAVDEFRTWWQLEPLKSDVTVTTQPIARPDISSLPPLRVGGDVKAPVITYRIEPVYPAEARANHISGIVIMEAIVGKDGRVRDVKVLKPLPFGLDQAAVDAVRQWQFRPGTLNGVPVDVIFNLTVNFKLDTPQPPQ